MKGLLFEWWPVNKEDVLEPRDLIPDLRVNLIASSLIWLSSDNDYLLNEGMQILSDYAIFNQNIYLSKAA